MRQAMPTPLVGLLGAYSKLPIGASNRKFMAIVGTSELGTGFPLLFSNDSPSLHSFVLQRLAVTALFCSPMTRRHCTLLFSNDSPSLHSFVLQ